MVSSVNPGKVVRIGGVQAFFEDSMNGHPALMRSGVNYLVYDYLAEVTMAILATDSTNNPGGFSPAFLRDIKPYLRELLDRKIKIITNWGGLNPDAAANAFRTLAADLGKECKVGVVRGDDLRPRINELRALKVKEMFSAEPLPEDNISGINAYLGGFPIAAALDAGADIVITGRVVDSALSLGPLIHEFRWSAQDYDKLASGTLIGHLLECSTQVTGGLFTDWETVPDPANIGNPIAECHEDGSFVVTKPAGTGGTVSVGTVAEQMIYEVSDPQSYFAPDVVCDFSSVVMQQIGPDRVSVTGTRGYPATTTYKVCATFQDGWRGQVYQPIIGINAASKARRQAEALFERTDSILRFRNVKPLKARHLEVIGAECTYGPRSRGQSSREVVAMMTVDHDEREGVEVFLKEQISAIVAMSPGTAMNLGGLTARGVLPRMKVFNFLLPKSAVTPTVTLNGRDLSFRMPPQGGYSATDIVRPKEPNLPGDIDPGKTVPLIWMAWGRSGDKGNLFNVGVFAREPRFYPYIAAALCAKDVGNWYAHLIDDPTNPIVERFLLPGTRGVNFVVHESLGGGATVCARIDTLAKAMGQILLEFPIPVSPALMQELARSKS
jgi:hypothetical protein